MTITDGQRVLETFGRSARRQRKMDRIDHLDAATKAVVHDWGWLTVKTMLEAGVTSPKHMRILLKTILYEHCHEYRVRKDDGTLDGE